VVRAASAMGQAMEMSVEGNLGKTLLSVPAALLSAIFDSSYFVESADRRIKTEMQRVPCVGSPFCCLFSFVWKIGRKTHSTECI
jgi:hypothetical protein